ncbi:hypothetical protein VOLCADRAFT_106845 [Volvox carteri f. nagariensis]|uniref:BTB domain-containing protein n=1 Tax=Volvox carteri f. nagariensis TaxID=3068 RepID=D8UA43_VOLCA|nr:uncharacterized protein VOLCADRAFT_106845 [Volvox carteri f. nagariensis]EFJ43410.1 hypothetical protein VOLCADRAFT_106845 [Volvox carteri f. nagariensis]|eukprot:XP_002955557.1 hypothetical protein VOLCADRAFT_106845 [Volvox carteri f. nagariensis]
MAAPVRVLGVSPATQQAGRACGVRRPDEFFSRDGPLGARADVRVLTSDGQELWLHRVVLEMWSRLFLDLIAAHEEEMDAMGSSSGSPFVTLALTDTAADLMLLLSCLYPTPYPKDRKQGSTLDAARCAVSGTMLWLEPVCLRGFRHAFEPDRLKGRLKFSAALMLPSSCRDHITPNLSLSPATRATQWRVACASTATKHAPPVPYFAHVLRCLTCIPATDFLCFNGPDIFPSLSIQLLSVISLIMTFR